MTCDTSTFPSYDCEMTTATSPPELIVSDEDEESSQDLQQPTPQRLEKFNLDDAFSVHEDEDPASLDLDPNSILRALQSRDAIIGEANDDSEDKWENADNETADMRNEQNSTYDSTETSISTLEIDPVELHHSPGTPPQASSSHQSMESEDSPGTPPDDPTVEIGSQFTTISLSPPSHSSPHSHIHEIDHTYPNVIIDASKSPITDVRNHGLELTPSVSQRTSGSSTTTFETPANATAPSLKIDSGSPLTTPPVGSPKSPSSPVHRSLPSYGKHRSSGPSTLQKVVSKTRPPYLPPKQKDEDEKHSREWEEMMQRSRLLGK